MPILTPSRTLGWGWRPDGKNDKQRADNVMVGLEKYMRLFPDAEDVRIIVSKRDTGLMVALQKVTKIPVVVLDGADIQRGLVIFRDKD